MSQREIEEIMRRLESIEDAIKNINNTGCVQGMIRDERMKNLSKKVDSIDMRFWGILIASGGTMITTLVQIILKLVA